MLRKSNLMRNPSVLRHWDLCLILLMYSDQVAAVNNVMSKYYNPLMLHQGDTDELLSNMLKELEQAGVNDIITEKQKQLDEWLAENKEINNF